ncbi:MAG: hypothetical protein JSW03_00295 [Candidatus Eiseniibacteriota bacterium]|nr:MAG: hypothetical protein JSW03_00295 [Candidatus Eisenbacteria bacterium]
MIKMPQPSLDRDVFLDRAIRTIIRVAFLVFVTLQIGSFWLSDTPQLVTRFADDAYFYFEIARNVVETGNLTFDGQTQTNGFHPLWLIVLLPIFRLASNPVAVLRIIGSSNVLLLGVAGWLGLRHISSRYPLFTFALSALVMIKLIGAFCEYSMETSLLVPLCIVSLVGIGKANHASLVASRNRLLLGVGVVLSMVQLARLDAVLLNFLMLVVVTGMNLSSGRKAKLLGKLFLLAGPAFLTGLAYFIANYSMFGHIVPVSAIAKSMGDGLLNKSMIRQFIEVAAAKNLTSVWAVFSCMLVLAGGYVVLWICSRRRMTSPARLDDSYCIPLTVSLFCLAFAGYYLIGTSWRLWGWYSYPGLLVGIFVFPLMVALVEDRFLNWSKTKAAFRAARVVLTAVLAITVCVVAVRWGYWLNVPVEGNFKYQNFLLAESLNANLARPKLVAQGDRAGSFAYFFDGNVLQLEGLVGDYELLEAIRNNTLMDYMSTSGVEYVISHTGPSSNYDRWTMLVPYAEFSSGPIAEVLLCKTTEKLRKETGAGLIIIWAWPSCGL